MRYASLRDMDISNGRGIGVALFVQGCHFHCKNCFNQTTWNFQEGKIWTSEIENKFFYLVSRPYIERVSFLGGEPLADENYSTILKLAKSIDNKEKWCYTGYTLEELKVNGKDEILKYIDVLVDGRYVDELRDLNLEFRGSSNQRILYRGKDF
jgi:anaerobic ribonucleoside-triphosphate reductase activating protein|uniref:4Fe-4S single cluster domain protein n=1 Tax=Myoviridae sp. ctqfO1 TaxID=2827710 RepID=A0A8S5T2Q8_9CAUD|nr:MAG TPA: 4Fe-4S single cluster domain protein [Myoviridae sp. ctqfO1]